MEEDRPEYVEGIQVGKRRSSLGALSKSKPVTKLKSMFEAKAPAPKTKEAGLLGKLKPISASHDGSSFAAALSSSLAATASQKFPPHLPPDQQPATPPEPLFSVLPSSADHDVMLNRSPARSIEDIRTSMPGFSDTLLDGSEADARSVKSPGSAGFLKRMGSSIKKALTPKSSAGKHKHDGCSPSYAGSDASNLSPRPSGQLLMTPTSQPSSTSLDLNCRSDQRQSAPPRSPSALMGYEVQSAQEEQDLARSGDGSMDIAARPVPSTGRPPRSPSVTPPSSSARLDGSGSQLEASPRSTSRDVVPRMLATASPDQGQSPQGAAAAGAPMAAEDSFVSAVEAQGCAAAGSTPSAAADGEDSFAASLTASPTVAVGSEVSRGSPPMREVNMGAAIFSPQPFPMPSDGIADASDTLPDAPAGELVFPSLPSTDLPGATDAAASTGAILVAGSPESALEAAAAADEPADVDMGVSDLVVPAEEQPPTASAAGSVSDDDTLSGTGLAGAADSSMEVDGGAGQQEPPFQQPLPLSSRRSFGASTSLNLDLTEVVAAAGSPGSPDTTTPTGEGNNAADRCIIGLTPVRPETAVMCAMHVDTPVLSTVAEDSPEPPSPEPLRTMDLAGDFDQASGAQEMDVELASHSVTSTVAVATARLRDIGTTMAAPEEISAPEAPVQPSDATEAPASNADSAAAPQAAAADMDWDDNAVVIPCVEAPQHPDSAAEHPGSPLTTATASEASASASAACEDVAIPEPAPPLPAAADAPISCAAEAADSAATSTRPGQLVLPRSLDADASALLDIDDQEAACQSAIEALGSTAVPDVEGVPEGNASPLQPAPSQAVPTAVAQVSGSAQPAAADVCDVSSSGPFCPCSVEEPVNCGSDVGTVSESPAVPLPEAGPGMTLPSEQLPQSLGAAATSEPLLAQAVVTPAGSAEPAAVIAEVTSSIKAMAAPVESGPVAAFPVHMAAPAPADEMRETSGLQTPDLDIDMEDTGACADAASSDAVSAYVNASQLPFSHAPPAPVDAEPVTAPPPANSSLDAAIKLESSVTPDVLVDAFVDSLRTSVTVEAAPAYTPVELSGAVADDTEAAPPADVATSGLSSPWQQEVGAKLEALETVGVAQLPAASVAVGAGVPARPIDASASVDEDNIGRPERIAQDEIAAAASFGNAPVPGSDAAGESNTTAYEEPPVPAHPPVELAPLVSEHPPVEAALIVSAYPPVEAAPMVSVHPPVEAAPLVSENPPVETAQLVSEHLPVETAPTPVEVELPLAFHTAAVEAAAAADGPAVAGHQQPVEADADLMDVDGLAVAQMPAGTAALEEEAPVAAPASMCNAGLERSSAVEAAASEPTEQSQQQPGAAVASLQPSPHAAVAPAAATAAEGSAVVFHLRQKSTDESMEHDFVAFGSSATDMSLLDAEVVARALIDPAYAALAGTASPVPAAAPTAPPQAAASETASSGPAPAQAAAQPEDPMMVSPLPSRLSILPPALRLAPEQAGPQASPEVGADSAPPSAAPSAGTPGMPTPISPETARLGVRAFQLEDIDEPEAAGAEAAPSTTGAPMHDQLPLAGDHLLVYTPNALSPPVQSVSPVVGGMAAAAETPALATVLAGAEDAVMASVEGSTPAAAPIAAPASDLGLVASQLAVSVGAAPPAGAPPALQCTSDLGIPATVLNVSAPPPAVPAGIDLPMADSLEAIEALWGNDDLLLTPGSDATGGVPLPQIASSPVSATKQSESPVLQQSGRRVAPGVVLQVQRESLDLFSLRNSCAARVSDSLMVESLDSFESMGLCAKSRAVGFVPMAPVKEGDEDAAAVGRASGSEGGSAPTSAGQPSPDVTFAVDTRGSPDSIATPGLNTASASTTAAADTPSANKPAAVTARGGGQTPASAAAVSQAKATASALKSAITGSNVRPNAAPSSALKAMAAANGTGPSAVKAGVPKRSVPAAVPPAKALLTPGQPAAGPCATLAGSRLPGLAATPLGRAATATPGAKTAVPSQAAAATPGTAPGRPGITPRTGGVFGSAMGHPSVAGVSRPGQFAQQPGLASHIATGAGLFDTPLIMRAAAVPLADTPLSGCEFDLDTVDISAEASKAIAMLGGGASGIALAESGTVTKHATPVLAPGRSGPIAGTPTMSVLETHVQLLTNKLVEAEANIVRLQDENGMLRDQLSTLQFESSMTNDLDMEREARQFLEQELAVVRHRSDGLEAELRTAHAEVKRREQAAAELLAAQQTKEAEWARKEAEMELRLQQMAAELEEARNFAQQAGGRIADAESRAAAAHAKAEEEAASSQQLKVTLGTQAHQLAQMVRSRDDEAAKFQKAMEQLIQAQTQHKKEVAQIEQKHSQAQAQQYNELRDRYRQVKAQALESEQRALEAEAKVQETSGALVSLQREKQELMAMCNQLLTQLEATKSKGGR